MLGNSRVNLRDWANIMGLSAVAWVAEPEAVRLLRGSRTVRRFADCSGSGEFSSVPQESDLASASRERLEPAGNAAEAAAVVPVAAYAGNTRSHMCCMYHMCSPSLRTAWIAPVRTVAVLRGKSTCVDVDTS